MTYGALKKDFAFICNLDKGELVFVEYNKVMPSMPGAMLEDSVKLKNHCSIPNSLLAFQCTLYVNGSTPSQTPLIETPSVSNDSLTTVDSRALANHSSSQFNKLVMSHNKVVFFTIIHELIPLLFIGPSNHSKMTQSKLNSPSFLVLMCR